MMTRREATEELSREIFFAFDDWCTHLCVEPGPENQPAFIGEVGREWERFKAAIDQAVAMLEDEHATSGDG